ncbi:MAG: GxxExxY protein [Phycisphaerae bacterium]
MRFSENEYPQQELTKRIIAAGVEVHRELGPGFVEKIYENALASELLRRGHKVDRQVVVRVGYRGEVVGEHRIDLMVDDSVVVELKTVDALAEVHKAQLRSTLKAAGKQVGLLINFNRPTLTEGVRRVIN